MIIERGSVVGRRNGEASAVTANGPEGTAVFIGRASFRMIPVARNDVSIARNDVSIQQDDGMATGASTATSALDAAWFDQGDEKVVLSPPEASVAGESPFDSSASPRRDGDIWVDRHRAFPLWTIAAALVAGATITLSAQALMKPPRRIALDAKPVDSTLPAPLPPTPTTAAAPSATAALPPPTSAPKPASPTVVPSTIVWAVNAQPPPRQSSRGASADRPRQARAAQTMPATRRARTFSWVDPFAEENEPAVTSGTGTSRKSVGPATAGKRPGAAAAERKAGNRAAGVWVDPFAE